jgi:hypothetical protein
MIYHGFKTVAVAGVAEPLMPVSTPCSFVTIFPRVVSGTPNVGEVRIGGKESLLGTYPPASIPPGSGMLLNVGDSGVAWPTPGPGMLNMNSIYIDALNSGDGVQFIYFK